MKPEDEMMNFFATIQARNEELLHRLAEFMALLDDFSQAEKEILLMVIFNNQKEIKKAPYLILQGLIKRGILTEVWLSMRAKGDPEIAFVGRVKTVHKSRQGKL